MEDERRVQGMIDALLYTIYVMFVLLVGLVVWSLIHQYLTRDR